MRIFKILIAGERTPDRRDVRLMLQTLGFTNFREASDGDDALRKLRAQKINLTICDIRMPLVSGVEINAIIRKEKFLMNHPLLVLVSDGAEAQMAREADPPLDGWIDRPIHPQVLEDKVAEVLFRRLEPSSVDVHLQASGTALAGGQFVTAHRELDMAAEINPDNPMVSYLRRMVFLAQGQNDKAEAAIKQARNAFVNRINLPKRVRKMFELGEARLDQSRWNEAQEAFDQAIEMALDKAKYKSLIGEAYLARGMADRAEAMFKASIEETPDDVHLYNRLGIAFRRQKKFAEAVSNYQKAIQIDPFEENLRYNLARAYLAAGDRENAAQALNKALEIMPDFKEAEKLLDRLQKTRQMTREDRG